MSAAEKMRGFGIEALATATGRSRSGLHRWAQALESDAGISDAHKRELILATRGTPFAIAWADFEPRDIRQLFQAAA